MSYPIQLTPKNNIPAEYKDQAILFQPKETDELLLPEYASCLSVKTFLKFCNIKYNTRILRNAEYMSPGGRFTKLPVLCYESFILSEFEPIVKSLTRKNTKFGGSLDADEEMDMRCYITLVENIFNMAEFYICYMDDTVYNTVTKPRNIESHPWPLNLFQNSVKRGSALRMLRAYQWHDMSLADVCERVEQCCNSLNFQLETSTGPYFYGDEPCELDAVVFGHLGAILTMPMPEDTLARIAKKFERLMQFCRFINTKYFQSEK